jgi:hypothetical protein
MHILFVLLQFVILNINHPVHISICNIEYMQEKNVYNISIRLFTDDFENILNRQNQTNIKFTGKDDFKNYGKIIEKYINNHFIFAVNEKNIFKTSDLNKIETKLDENTVWLYYEVKATEGKKISIKNTLLNDLYNDQNNLFLFTYKNTQEAFKFDKNNTTFEFVIK